MKNKENLIIFCGIFVLLFSVALVAYQSGKKRVENKVIKTEIKTSEKKVETYKKEYDSLKIAFSGLEKQKQEVKMVYLKGKETIKYITKERIKSYTDTICKDDVLTLKLQLNNSDSLISIQEKQINTQSTQLVTAGKIILEKDKQINLYKKLKPKSKPLGIGIIGGYGTDFRNGLTPFIGVGVSYNLIRL